MLQQQRDVGTPMPKCAGGRARILCQGQRGQPKHILRRRHNLNFLRAAYHAASVGVAAAAGAACAAGTVAAAAGAGAACAVRAAIL